MKGIIAFFLFVLLYTYIEYKLAIKVIDDTFLSEKDFISFIYKDK